MISAKILYCAYVINLFLSTFPNRAGNSNIRLKKVDIAMNTVLHNVSQLFDQFSLCDRNAANYLGILSRGDCVAVSTMFLCY